jgi:hypothetical protein
MHSMRAEQHLSKKHQEDWNKRTSCLSFLLPTTAHNHTLRIRKLARPCYQTVYLPVPDLIPGVFKRRKTAYRQTEQ